MKYIYILLIGVSHTLSKTICPSQTCSTKDEYPNCAIISNFSNKIEWHKCRETDRICIPNTPNSYKCSKPNLPPGSFVPEGMGVNCYSGKEINGVCMGVELNGNCTSDIDCDVALFCSPDTGSCKNLVAVGEECSPPGKGYNVSVCVPYALCINSRCVRFGSLALGETNLEFINAACESNYVHPLLGLCAIGWQLDQGLPISIHDKCPISYKGKNVTHDSMFIQASTPICGLRADQLGLCRPGPQNTKQYLKTISSFLKKIEPGCHILDKELYGLCEMYAHQDGFEDAYMAAIYLTYFPMTENSINCSLAQAPHQLKYYYEHGANPNPQHDSAIHNQNTLLFLLIILLILLQTQN